MAQKGLLVFEHTGEVIKAESALREAGFSVEIMGPPPELRSGCDMVVVFDCVRELAVRQILQGKKLTPLRVLPLSGGMLEPVSLFHGTDLGQWRMVRAANMKITVAKADGRIVNISGGGCPDVPYLASLLVGKTLDEAREPREQGQTLCAFSLQKAYEEIQRWWRGNEHGEAGSAKTPLTPEARPCTDYADFCQSLAHSMDSFKDDPAAAASSNVSAAASADAFAGGCPVWLVCGSVPLPDFPLVDAVWRLDGEYLRAEQVFFPQGKAEIPELSIQRGTPALLASTLAAMDGAALRRANPSPVAVRALLTGDVGDGRGSRALYRHMQENLDSFSRLAGITFHYLYPDVDGHSRVMAGLENLAASGKPRPLLVADAGFMYAAKMSGYAASYDFFTPDAGEMAFLADEKAPHPFYTRGFLLAGDEDIPRLLRSAAAGGNCARHLLIKGRVDRVARLISPGQAGITAEVSAPDIPFMEPVGGTGDMVTGMLTALLASGCAPEKAALLAARANREIGRLSRPTPATQVAELIPWIERIFAGKA